MKVIGETRNQLIKEDVKQEKKKVEVKESKSSKEKQNKKGTAKIMIIY